MATVVIGFESNQAKMVLTIDLNLYIHAAPTSLKQIVVWVYQYSINLNEHCFNQGSNVVGLNPKP